MNTLFYMTHVIIIRVIIKVIITVHVALWAYDWINVVFKGVSEFCFNIRLLKLEPDSFIYFDLYLRKKAQHRVATVAPVAFRCSLYYRK